MATALIGSLLTTIRRRADAKDGAGGAPGAAGDGGSAADKEEILDEEEQEALVQDFRLANLRSNSYFKKIMTLLVVVLIAVYMVLMMANWAASEELIADRATEDKANTAKMMVWLTNAASSLGLLACIAYLHRKPSMRTWASAVVLGSVALAPSAYWLLRWSDLDAELGPFVLLPVLPAIIFAVVVYAVYDMDGSDRAVEQLQQAMYKVKSA